MPPRRAALQASRSLRELSSSPEPEPAARSFPKPPAKRPPPTKEDLSISRKHMRTKKNYASTIPPQPSPAHSKPVVPEVIELTDSDDDQTELAADEPLPVVEDDGLLPVFTGAPVWVRLRTDGALASCASKGDIDAGLDTFWWPSGVTQGFLNGQGPIVVHFLSPLPGTARRTLDIPSPDSSVVRPMRRNNRPALSFHRETYWCSASSTSTPKATSSKFKKQLDALFTVALKRMHHADVDAEMNDDLPSVLTASLGDKPRYASLSPISDTQIQPDRWSPPPPDPSLDIPGEAVLALWRKDKTTYWPARIKEYIPPATKSDTAQYLVEYLDESFAKITRHQFYTSLDREFYVCKLGKFESSDTQSDEDHADDRGAWGDLNISYIPQIPPPPAEHFVLLPCEHQFAYITPVLEAAIKNAYSPGRSRHERFICGGRSRTSLRKEGFGSGNMTTRTFTRFWDLVNTWALGPLQAHEDEVCDVERTPLTGTGNKSTLLPPPSDILTVVEEDKPSLSASESRPTVRTELRHVSSPRPLPAGCEEYESLTPNDRREYCYLVLAPEAMLQLLLWRHGKRQSYELLSDMEEQALRDEAVELAAWSDVVEEVMHCRNMRIFAQLAKDARTADDTAFTTGSRSRPRRTASVRS